MGIGRNGAVANRCFMFEGCTNGHERIIAMGLTNEQVAKRIIDIYKGMLLMRQLIVMAF